MLLAVAALVALVIALLTGATVPALAVVALAVAGIVMLVRDWRASSADDNSEPEEPEVSESHLEANDLSPDISTRPGGPSSDARADQR